MQHGRKAVWSIPYVSVTFFPSLKHSFIAYRSSKVSSRPDYIFVIHQLWQPGFIRVYSNSCCSCLFEPKIIKVGQSSHKMHSNNILSFQESTKILNACTKKSVNLLKAPRIYSPEKFITWFFNGDIFKSFEMGLSNNSSKHRHHDQILLIAHNLLILLFHPSLLPLSFHASLGKSSWQCLISADSLYLSTNIAGFISRNR